MPLAIPLATLRRDLQELLTDDLAGALKTLRDLLPERSEKHATVVGLLGRLSDANKARLRNTLSNEALQREYDTLRANLLDLLADLTEADFDAVAAAPPDAAGKPVVKQGSVLYRIPHVMPMRRETKCVVRIALDEEAIVEDIQLDEHINLKALRRVSDLMQVELTDPSADGVFRIRSTSEAQQLVLEDGYTEWFFYVQPLREGEWPLEVKVAVIELALGKECKREFVLSETIQIVTETPAVAEESPLKAAGYVLPFRPPAATKAPESYPSPPGSVPPSTEWQGSLPPSAEPPQYSVPPVQETPPPARSSNNGLRALAVFLAFLVVGAGTTWAATPPDTRDWWLTRYVENTPEAYTEFVQEHPQSKYRDAAFYRKAVLTALPADYRAYLDSIGTQGKYYEQAKQQMKVLEVKYFDLLRTDPTLTNVQQYLHNFSTGERLSEIKQIVQNRAELLPILETAYVEAVRQNPSVATVQQYLTDFPESQRLAEVQQVVDAYPEVKQQVQTYLEDAYLKKVQENPTADQVRDYLQNVDVPTRLPELNKLLDGMPKLKRQVQPEIRQAEERREKLLPEFLEKGGKGLGMLENNPAPDKQPASASLADNKPAGEPTSSLTTSLATESKPAETTAETPAGTVEPAMVLVRGGSFMMGSPATEQGRENDETQHSVTVSSFYMGKYEVTQAEWVKIMGNNPSSFKNCDQCPVERVSWNDVEEYIKKLNTKTGKKYRLPTEAEWEYAAKGGQLSSGVGESIFIYAGSNKVGEVAWYVDNSGTKTHAVGGKKPNQLGLFDMSGNVWEWCADRYDAYPTAAQTDPQGLGTGGGRVLRGGAWYNAPRSCRAADRFNYEPTIRDNSQGFRLVLQ